MEPEDCTHPNQNYESPLTHRMVCQECHESDRLTLEDQWYRLKEVAQEILWPV